MKDSHHYLKHNSRLFLLVVGIISLQICNGIMCSPSERHALLNLPFQCLSTVLRADPYANLITTLRPSALASLTLQDKQHLPFLLINAFHPLSAHKALANISVSLPNLPLCPADKCGDGVGRVGNAVIVLSVQSITRTLGIGLFVVWVVDWLGSPAGDCGGDSSELNAAVAGIVRTVERGSLVKVNAL
jgi:hypothetical protein